MHQVRLRGVTVPVTLAVPTCDLRGGLVALHPADDPRRDQPLLRHLAEVLPEHGVAVLLHDRRPATELSGDTVPLRLQAEDAHAVAAALREALGPVPVGFWGWSQGAWAAAVAAAQDDVAFVVLVGAAGVSPAQQMRWAASQQLRQHGYSEQDVAAALDVRRTYEAALRGDASAARAQHALDDVAQKPWAAHAGLPACFRGPGTWPDMDFDPVPVYERINCPVLAVWGDADPWIPVDVSEAVLRGAIGHRLTVLRLPATGHGPDIADRRYEAALIAHVLRALPVRDDHE